jgi:hypothetical protein
VIDQAIRYVLGEEGSAAMVTAGSDGPHLVATWQSYVHVLDDQTLVFPAGGMRQTEANVKAGSPVQLLVSVRYSEGKSSGTGYRLSGVAEFQTDTPAHDLLRKRFPWCRAAVVMTVDKAEKVLG